jgi:hypothetical protein
MMEARVQHFGPSRTTLTLQNSSGILSEYCLMRCGLIRLEGQGTLMVRAGISDKRALLSQQDFINNEYIEVR